jgi:hypothetical protein
MRAIAARLAQHASAAVQQLELLSVMESWPAEGSRGGSGKGVKVEETVRLLLTCSDVIQSFTLLPCCLKQHSQYRSLTKVNNSCSSLPKSRQSASSIQ